MRIVNAELEYLVFEPRKEFITMVVLAVGNIPLLYFLNQSWYDTLMHTIPGPVSYTHLALADVKIGDFMTIRNVRIKEDDYGLTVAMPKTKAGANEQYKDTVFFADRGIKERFDQTVQKAYETFMHQQTDLDEEPEEAEELEQEESGMNMGM